MWKKWWKNGAKKQKLKTRSKHVKLTGVLAVVLPAPTSNQASHLQAAAAASTHCGEAQKEGQQSQQQSEEERERKVKLMC